MKSKCIAIVLICFLGIAFLPLTRLYAGNPEAGADTIIGIFKLFSSSPKKNPKNNSPQHTVIVGDDAKQVFVKSFRKVGLDLKFIRQVDEIKINYFLLVLFEVRIDSERGAVILALKQDAIDSREYRYTEHLLLYKPSDLPKLRDGLSGSEVDKKRYLKEVFLKFSSCDLGPLPDEPARSTKEESPLDILKKRYAKGEISKEEFDRMKEDLK